MLSMAQEKFIHSLNCSLLAQGREALIMCYAIWDKENMQRFVFLPGYFTWLEPDKT